MFCDVVCGALSSLAIILLVMDGYERYWSGKIGKGREKKRFVPCFVMWFVIPLLAYQSSCWLGTEGWVEGVEKVFSLFCDMDRDSLSSL